MALPIYTIDLSLPPRERYAHVAAEFAEKLHPLSALLDVFIRRWGLPIKLVHFIAWLFLYQLYSFEQTEEIRGMSETCNIPLYILIVWNVSIDTYLGCTSGGAAVYEPGSTEPTMMQFRVLDWAQDAMRHALAQFEYVEKPGGPVIARTLGLAGHVGVLTGVRKGLSLNISYRPSLATSLWSAERLLVYWNLFMVIMGWRPSITTFLRDCLLPRQPQGPERKQGLFKTWKWEDRKPHTYTNSLPPYGMDHVINVLPTMRTSMSYITFSTPTETVVLEKTFLSGEIRRSSTFINVTNHDVALDVPHEANIDATDAEKVRFKCFQECANRNIGLQRSLERYRGVMERWSEWQMEQAREESKTKGLTLPRLVEIVRFYPVINSKTYFFCVMDPKEGVFRWIETFEEGGARKQREMGLLKGGTFG